MNRELDYVSGSEGLAGREEALVVVPAKEKENGAEEFVAGGIAELGEAMARYSIGEVSPLGLDEVSTGDKIAEALAKVEIGDPSLNIPDADTDQEVVRVAALTIAKARAVAEKSSDSKVKSKLYDFGDGVATKVADFLSTPMTRRRFLGSAVTAVLGLALAASGLAKSTVTATTTATHPAITQPASETVSPVITETATSTETTPPLPAVPPLDGKCMLGRTCPNSGDLSSVTWPVVSYDNGCELYPTYTEEALKALNESRKMQGLDPVPGEGYRPSAKQGEDGYADPNLPIGKCGAPEVKGYRFIGWYGDEWYTFPLYEKDASSSQLIK